eukprot:3780624-Pleurochrysis_carterae.AAC.3
MEKIGAYVKDYFQSVLMSALREQTFSSTLIAGKQYTLDFLNGKRLVPKRPHHPQLAGQPIELVSLLALLQLDIIRRNANSAKVEAMRSSNRDNMLNQVEALFAGPTPATLTRWLMSKAEQLGLESWHGAPADIVRKALSKKNVEVVMPCVWQFSTHSSHQTS